MIRTEAERVHFRTCLTLTGTGDDSAWDVVTGTLLSWVREKEDVRSQGSRLETPIASALTLGSSEELFPSGGLDVPRGYSGGTGTHGQPSALATDALAASGDDARVWALEYDEPDGNWDLRRWHTSVGVVEAPDGSCRVNVRVSHYIVPGYIGAIGADPVPTTPRFVRALLADERVDVWSGATRVLSGATRLSPGGFLGFVSCLLDPMRELPLVLMSSDSEGRYPVPDAQGLASSLLAMANVYTIDWRDDAVREACRMLFAKGTPAWSYGISENVVRVYQPGVRLDDTSGGKGHRFLSRNSVRQYGEGTSGFVHVLASCLALGHVTTEADVVDLSDVSRERSRRAAAGWQERYKELKEKARRREEREAGKGDLEGRDDAAEAKRLRGEVKRLTREVGQWEALAEEAEDAARRDAEAKVAGLKFHLEEANASNAELRREVARLGREASAIESLAHIPTSVAEALELAGTTWPDRLVILPEALRSAEDFRGRDLDEAWGVASSLAKVLWSLYFEGERSSDLEEEYRNRSGFELSGNETSLTKESVRMRRSRERTYEGRTVLCWAHVKGKSTNPELALRAHYWVDADKELIVVGHFGKHLETSGTARVSA